MNNLFILLLMVFMHIIDDYFLQAQGVLSQLKQKKYWADYPIFYKNDFIMALFFHSFSWAFMIMLPIAYKLNFNINIVFILFFAFNLITHGIVDHLKANEFKLNLIHDQIIHLIQIILTWLIFL